MPDLILLLTAEHSVASARIYNRSTKSGVLTPIAQRMRESEKFFHERENVSRRFATGLAPVLELDTTALSVEEMCDSAWSLVAPKLNW
jgi:hypothetical protein